MIGASQSLFECRSTLDRCFGRCLCTQCSWSDATLLTKFQCELIRLSHSVGIQAKTSLSSQAMSRQITLRHCRCIISRLFMFAKPCWCSVSIHCRCSRFGDFGYGISKQKAKNLHYFSLIRTYMKYVQLLCQLPLPLLKRQTRRTLQII